jgi:hypothetical protein
MCVASKQASTEVCVACCSQAHWATQSGACYATQPFEGLSTCDEAEGPRGAVPFALAPIPCRCAWSRRTRLYMQPISRHPLRLAKPPSLPRRSRPTPTPTAPQAQLRRFPRATRRGRAGGVRNKRTSRQRPPQGWGRWFTKPVSTLRFLAALFLARSRLRALGTTRPPSCRVPALFPRGRRFGLPKSGES